MTTVEDDAESGRRTVRIPGSRDHAGHDLIAVTLRWVCTVCDGLRDDVHPAISYDGSCRLACDGWTNPCGHVDTYAAARREAAADPVSRPRAQQLPPNGRT